MTEPTDKQRVELRLPAATVAAAKRDAHHRFLSLNAWAEEAFDFYLEAVDEKLGPMADIVRAFANASPIWHADDDEYHECVLCSARLPVHLTDHDPACPWRRAVELVGPIFFDASPDFGSVDEKLAQGREK